MLRAPAPALRAVPLPVARRAAARARAEPPPAVLRTAGKVGRMLRPPAAAQARAPLPAERGQLAALVRQAQLVRLAVP